MVGSVMFNGRFEVELAKNYLGKGSSFTFEEIVIKPTSAVRGSKALSMSLLFTCSESIQNA